MARMRQRLRPLVLPRVPSSFGLAQRLGNHRGSTHLLTTGLTGEDAEGPFPTGGLLGPDALDEWNIPDAHNPSPSAGWYGEPNVGVDIVFNEPTATFNAGNPTILRRDNIGIIASSPYTVLWKYDTPTAARMALQLAGVSCGINPARPSGLYCSNINSAIVDAVRFTDVAEGWPVTIEGIDIYPGDRTAEFMGLGAEYVQSTDPLVNLVNDPNFATACAGGNWSCTSTAVITAGTPGSARISGGVGEQRIVQNDDAAIVQGETYRVGFNIIEYHGAADPVGISVRVSGTTNAVFPAKDDFSRQEVDIVAGAGGGIIPVAIGSGQTDRDVTVADITCTRIT